MEHNATVDDVIFYNDGNVVVTNREVKLGAHVYSTADVRYAGIAESFRDVEIGKIKISYGLLNSLIWCLTYLPATFLFGWLFGNIEEMRDYRLSYAAFLQAFS